MPNEETKKSNPLKEQTDEEVLVLNLLNKMKIAGSELSQKKKVWWNI